MKQRQEAQVAPLLVQARGGGRARLDVSVDDINGVQISHRLHERPHHLRAAGTPMFCQRCLACLRSSVFHSPSHTTSMLGPIHGVNHVRSAAGESHVGLSELKLTHPRGYKVLRDTAIVCGGHVDEIAARGQLLQRRLF